MKPIAYIIGGILAYAIFIVPSIVLGGYVLATLWAWFVVALFNAPALTIAEAIGLHLIIGFMAHQYQLLAPEEDDLKKKLAHIALYLYARPLLALLTGWVVTWFL